MGRRSRSRRRPRAKAAATRNAAFRPSPNSTASSRGEDAASSIRSRRARISRAVSVAARRGPPRTSPSHSAVSRGEVPGSGGVLPRLSRPAGASPAMRAAGGSEGGGTPKRRPRGALGYRQGGAGREPGKKPETSGSELPATPRLPMKRGRERLSFRGAGLLDRHSSCVRRGLPRGPLGGRNRHVPPELQAKNLAFDSIGRAPHSTGPVDLRDRSLALVRATSSRGRPPFF